MLPALASLDGFGSKTPDNRHSYRIWVPTLLIEKDHTQTPQLPAHHYD
jgi:hypothetical protein